MSLQVRPGYVNPLTMMKDTKNNPLKKQAGNTQDESSDRLAELRTKQQTLQNEILIMQSTGTDSAANATEKVESLQKQLESVSSELRAAQNDSSSSAQKAALTQLKQAENAESLSNNILSDPVLKPDVDTYEKTEKESGAAFTKSTSADRGPEEETPAVKMSLSSEGIQSYRNNLMDNSESDDSV